jgi:hypothetical protein
MNLFFINVDPKKCAEEHCDKHVVKMVLEIVQMLYTALHINGNSTGNGLPEFAYKISHVKHPTSIWIRSCFENWNYAITVAKCLSEEYTYRYNKIHSCQKHIDWLLLNTPNFSKGVFKIDQSFSSNKEFESMGMTPVPLAMPDECKLDGTIDSYRNYYIMKIQPFARWTSRPIPRWYTSINLRKIFN